MEKELKELIRKNDNDLQRHERERDTLRGRMKFYSEHNLAEEKRIAHIKLQAIDGIIYDYRDLLKNLQKLLPPK
jgi:hypothetical protein